jgi:tubulin---tyrosine ligase
MKFVVLSPLIHVVKTLRFSVAECKHCTPKAGTYNVDLDINCAYSAILIEETIRRRPWCTTGKQKNEMCKIQIKDFENIDWEPVMKGACGASSYLVRKGLSRKAQLSLQIKRYCSKNPTSVLHKSSPYTVVIETWNAFEEMKLDFGRGTFASFEDQSLSRAPLRQKLDWCLTYARSIVEEDSNKDVMWILKPSVTNKGIDISVVRDWDGVLTALESADHIREWVLQRYIERPLLVGGHKFHLRVYVLCVGALRVFVYDRILMLIAAHK